MSYHIKEQQYVDVVPSGEYLLVADIGGTNTNFGVTRVHNDHIELLVSLHIKSQDVDVYADLIQSVCNRLQDQYDIRVHSACFGVAGIVHDHRRCVEPTNLKVTLDAQSIVQHTQLEDVVITNDFVLVATGIDHIDQEDIVCVIDGDGFAHGNKAALGAGTGLGQVGMLWHAPVGQHIPCASEGGHGDFAIHDNGDVAFVQYLQHHANKHAPISWEDVLSGDGIRHIYQFLGTQYTYPDTHIARIIASENYTPDKISEYAQQDKRAYDTFVQYARWYGRCAKNLALQMLAFNGVYIAGGIAAKNVAMFRNEAFRHAFYNSHVHIQFLKNTPVYVIADYNVSLYGAASYYHMRKNGIV